MLRHCKVACASEIILVSRQRISQIFIIYWRCPEQVSQGYHLLTRHKRNGYVLNTEAILFGVHND